MDLLDILKYRLYYYMFGHFMKYIDRGLEAELAAESVATLVWKP